MTTIPLMIGVTGHRDLVEAELPDLERALERFFGDVQKRFPDLPLLVTTPLAEGADRLVAQVAWRLGIDINILLPMPLHLYRSDFADGSCSVFEEMMGYGEVIELPLLNPSPADGSLDRSALDAQYEYLGIYLAAHSHILLAVWNGHPSGAAGGTSEVVRYHQENVAGFVGPSEPRSVIDFSEDESDLVFHLSCSRRSEDRPPALPPGSGRWLTRDDLMPSSEHLPERYAAVFRRQEQLNEDLHRIGGQQRREAPARAGPDDIGDLLVAVDTLAMRFQRLALRALRGMFALTALAGLTFISYADFPDQDPLIWFYLLFLGCGFGLYALERRGGWYRRYLDYRGLAEGLRVQYQWARAGVRPTNPTEFSHDSFMKRQELELGWIRNAMRYAARRTDVPSPDPAQEGTAQVGLEAVVVEWVGDEHAGQNNYYRSRVSYLLKRSRLTRLMSVGAVLIGLSAAVTLAAFQATLDDFHVNLLIAAMAGLPFLAAVRAGYAQRISESELIAQYSRMARIYSNAHRLLRATPQADARRSILLALGKEALQEVGQWMLRHRERPITGGHLFHSG